MTLSLLAPVAAQQQDIVKVTVNADPLDCVLRVSVFSETRMQPVKMSFDGRKWVSEPLNRGEVVTVSFEPAEDCRDTVIINDVTLERFYGTRASQILTYDASYTIRSRKIPTYFVTVEATPPECLVTVSSSKPVKKEGGIYVIGPVKAEEAVNINPVIGNGCAFKEWAGDPYAAASPKPGITLKPAANTSLTLILTKPSPSADTTTTAGRDTGAATTPLDTLLERLQQYLPAAIGAVAFSTGGYMAYKTLSTARERRRREEDFQRRLAVAKTALSQSGKSLILKRGWLWLEVDPVEEVLHGTDIDRVTTAYLMLASVIPVSPKMRKRLYHETVNEYNAATGSTITGYAPHAALASAGETLIKLSVQLALEDADAVEQIRKEITRRGGDPWTIPKHLIGLDTVVYEARGISIFDLGFRLESEKQPREEAVVKTLKCPSCGTTVFESFRYCVSCGESLHEKTPEPQPQRAESLPQTIKNKPTEAKPVEPAKPQKQKPLPKAAETTQTKPAADGLEQAIETKDVARPVEAAQSSMLVERKTEWQLPKWLADELDSLGASPEQVMKAAEKLAYSDNLEKDCYRAAYAIAREMGITDPDELDSFAANLATLLPYAVQEYRSSLEMLGEKPEQKAPPKQETVAVEEPPQKIDVSQPRDEEKEENTSRQRMKSAEPAHPRPEPQQRTEREKQSVETISLERLVDDWRRPGTIYLLDDTMVLVAGLPTAIVARHFAGRGRVFDVEKAVRTVPENLLAKYVEREPCLLILTRGRYPRRRIRTTEVEEAYKPLKLLKDVATRASPDKLIILTHPRIYDHLPEHVRNRLNKVHVTLPLDEAGKKLRETLGEHAQHLAVAQALIPELADKLVEGFEALKQSLTEYLPEEDAQLVAETLYAKAYGQPIPEHVPKALPLSFGIVED